MSHSAINLHCTPQSQATPGTKQRSLAAMLLKEASMTSRPTASVTLLQICLLTIFATPLVAQKIDPIRQSYNDLAGIWQ